MRLESLHCFSVDMNINAADESASKLLDAASLPSLRTLQPTSTGDYDVSGCFFYSRLFHASYQEVFVILGQLQQHTWW